MFSNNENYTLLSFVSGMVRKRYNRGFLDKQIRLVIFMYTRYSHTKINLLNLPHTVLVCF